MAFVTDSTLGKLTRLLRLAGFDTHTDRGAPDAVRLALMAGGRRLVLTRSRHVKNALADQQVLLITHDQPAAQLHQVITALHVKKADLRPMTRCALCNALLGQIAKDHLRGRIPDFVWQQHNHFKICPVCARVYWSGSHAERWNERMESIFPRNGVDGAWPVR